MAIKACPFCGSSNCGMIQPPAGANFVLNYVTSKEDGKLGGMPVVVYGCQDCKCIWMASGAFAGQDNDN